MLRIQPIANAKAAETYYAKSDGGYYVAPDDLGREWVGRGANLLELSGPPDYEQFKRLIHGLDPHSGGQLTAKLVDHRIPAWDVNLHCSKGVTIAIERGDTRLQQAFWEAARETVADLERLATTRVRESDKHEDRITGNLVGYAVEHAETRPVGIDQKPDPHRHLHMVIFNLTWDQVEEKWKAVKFRPIMDQRKYFDRRFNQRFAAKVAALGYDIETKWDRDAKGVRKYIGWDIKGIPESVIKKFSRRSAEIDKLADELGVTSPVAKDKLGATSRLNKRKDLTVEECRKHWDSKITPDEARAIAETIRDAIQIGSREIDSAAEDGMAYAIAQHFVTQSVVRLTDLEITAMERTMGSSLPEHVEAAGKTLGVLVSGRDATTKRVLAEERRIIAFARDGRGTCRPLGPTDRKPLAGDFTLSADQERTLRHIWESTDRVIMVEGDAGTGKTDAMRLTIPGIDKPGVFLAPSATASRGELRSKGFKNADTLAQFLLNEKFQNQARDGFIYIDEAPLAPISDIDRVLALAEKLNARVILQGDRKQHASVQRGSLFHILDEYAGLPIARLTEVFRQNDATYKKAVAAIAEGNIVGGFDILCKLGWIKETSVAEGHRPLVQDYLAAIQTRKPGGQMMSALVVAPSRAEGEAISSEIRGSMKKRGLIGKDDRVFTAYRPLYWTEAERGDIANYTGNEIIQFHRNSGKYKAGERITSAELVQSHFRPEHFSVYRKETIDLAVGDAIRITYSGKTRDGRHKLDNGTLYTIDEFTPGGNIRLNNGWIVDKTFAHLTHGYVTTSFSSQGRTVDRVLISMGRQSAPAIDAKSFYVSVSRARDRCTIYSDMPRFALREAIQRIQPRLSATDLIVGKRPASIWRAWSKSFVRSVRAKHRLIRERVEALMPQPTKQRDHGYAR